MKRLLLGCVWMAGCSQAQAILVRDIDTRPLSKVSLRELSPAAKKAVQSILDDQATLFTDLNANGTNPVKPEFLLERIPVAPVGHHLYELSLTGEFGCTGNTPNCRTAVLDETPSGVDVVDDNGFAGVAVVRRPNLQLPDLVLYEQEGHFGMSTVVYRFDGTAWKLIRCAYADIADFPPKRIVADKPCQP